MAARSGRPSPNPGFGPVVELRRCHLHRSLDLIGIRKALPSERITAEEAPPAFLEVEPTRSFGTGGIFMLCQQ